MRWRQREATGDMIFVRYADDFIVGFQHEHDARRFLDEMRERLGKFALTRPGNFATPHISPVGTNATRRSAQLMSDD